jgi:hypothetical protein
MSGLSCLENCNLCVLVSGNKNVICNKNLKIIFIMTGLPAISVSSIMSVELHFKQEAESYFYCKERTPHAACMRTACEVEHDSS